ncbi:uncharacterized protein MONBRDRAFT_9484 [Monosiga brevicollis MX1]|uniref:non-specific protein-tyrosine kinase n=1 Tax=Monosiga brevicollis TaxID=81824 RepID=A9V3A6_MONBE|nr:uncharacterized protein MONBRDRAFT_9484 [Monosiga brevicollis MX1]EDQ88155.1 predicted protein [Monosiga brevicollis MX1]|eukprot:XP_001747231.1 hypothetical protein [Monosiga brevicollis MX1]
MLLPLFAVVLLAVAGSALLVGATVLATKLIRRARLRHSRDNERPETVTATETSVIAVPNEMMVASALSTDHGCTRETLEARDSFARIEIPDASELPLGSLSAKAKAGRFSIQDAFLQQDGQKHNPLYDSISSRSGAATAAVMRELMESENGPQARSPGRSTLGGTVHALVRRNSCESDITAGESPHNQESLSPLRQALANNYDRMVMTSASSPQSASGSGPGYSTLLDVNANGDTKRHSYAEADELAGTDTVPPLQRAHSYAEADELAADNDGYERADDLGAASGPAPLLRSHSYAEADELAAPDDDGYDKAQDIMGGSDHHSYAEADDLAAPDDEDGYEQADSLAAASGYDKAQDVGAGSALRHSYAEADELAWDDGYDKAQDLVSHSYTQPDELAADSGYDKAHDIAASSSPNHGYATPADIAPPPPSFQRADSNVDGNYHNVRDMAAGNVSALDSSTETAVSEGYTSLSNSPRTRPLLRRKSTKNTLNNISSDIRLAELQPQIPNAEITFRGLLHEVGIYHKAKDCFISLPASARSAVAALVEGVVFNRDFTPSCSVPLSLGSGQGVFGTVAKAMLEQANGRSDLVTILVLPDDENALRHRAVDMIRALKKLDHPSVRALAPHASRPPLWLSLQKIAFLLKVANLICPSQVVKFLGIHLVPPRAMLALEHMVDGHLASYLARQGKNVPLHRRMEFAMDVATGMDYLASVGVVHRDLRAENVWVCRDFAKLYDFGYSRQASNDVDQLTWAWMAPELNARDEPSDREHTILSDVFSFGVFLMELVATNGGLSYPTEWSQDLIKRQVETGYRLSRPADCPESVFTIATRCWHSTPAERPDFEWLVKRIKVTQGVLTTQERLDARAKQMSPVPKLMESEDQGSAHSIQIQAEMRRPVPRVSSAFSASSEDWNRIANTGQLHRAGTDSNLSHRSSYDQLQMDPLAVTFVRANDGMPTLAGAGEAASDYYTRMDDANRPDLPVGYTPMVYSRSGSKVMPPVLRQSSVERAIRSGMRRYEELDQAVEFPSLQRQQLPKPRMSMRMNSHTSGLVIQQEGVPDDPYEEAWEATPAAANAPQQHVNQMGHPDARGGSQKGKPNKPRHTSVVSEYDDLVDVHGVGPQGTSPVIAGPAAPSLNLPGKGSQSAVVDENPYEPIPGETAPVCIEAEAAADGDSGAYMTPRALLEPEWLHGCMDRTEAAELVQLKALGGGLPGAYFVRRKTEANSFAITVMSDWAQVDHYLLNYDDALGWYMNGSTQQKCGGADENLTVVVAKLSSDEDQWRLPLTVPVSCLRRNDASGTPNLPEPVVQRRPVAATLL